MAPPEIWLRCAARGDVDAIVSLVLASSSTFAAWAPPSWQAPLAELERAYWWGRLPGDVTRRTVVAVDGPRERIVGVVSWAQALEIHGLLLPIPGLAHVSALFVHPSRWRAGIGDELLAGAEAAMAAAGFSHAELWTPADGPARAFYEARDWRADGRQEWSTPLGLTVVGYAKTVAPVAPVAPAGPP